MAKYFQVHLRYLERESDDRKFGFGMNNTFPCYFEASKHLALPIGNYNDLTAAYLWLSLSHGSQLLFCSPYAAVPEDQPNWVDNSAIAAFITNNNNLFKYKIIHNLSSGGFKWVEAAFGLSPVMHVKDMMYKNLGIPTTDEYQYYMRLSRCPGGEWVDNAVWFDSTHGMFRNMEWDFALSTVE